MMRAKGLTKINVALVPLEYGDKNWMHAPCGGHRGLYRCYRAG